MAFKNPAASLLVGLIVCAASTVQAGQDAEQLHNARIQHVLLISVDGLHALDVSRFIKSHPNSALADLAGHGVT